MFNTETNTFGAMPENNQALECPSSFSQKGDFDPVKVGVVDRKLLLQASIDG